MKIQGSIVVSKDNSVLITPDDTRKDAAAFDKWDEANKDRVQKMPTLSTNPRHNRVNCTLLPRDDKGELLGVKIIQLIFQCMVLVNILLQQVSKKPQGKVVKIVSSLH